MFVVHDSGGVADAQPPATGFYPCQDTDSPKDTTTTHCDDWQWETDAFSHPLLAGLFALEAEIQIQLATTHPNRCCVPFSTKIHISKSDGFQRAFQFSTNKNQGAISAANLHAIPFGTMLKPVIQWMQRGKTMVTIQVDEQTAIALQTAATGAGVSLADYVKSLVVANPREAQTSSWDALEKEIINLSVDGSLPTNFSRADIYADHD
jgi:hypothetical protein